MGNDNIALTELYTLKMDDLVTERITTVFQLDLNFRVYLRNQDVPIFIR